MNRLINVNVYAGKILAAIPRGILLTTKFKRKVNTMTIGWGTLGTNWGKNVFVAYIRQGRYTREILDSNPEFTLNIPIEHVKEAKRIIGICGSNSGRKTDKIALAGLELSKPEKISVPGIVQFPLTLECKVIYRQVQELPLLRDDDLRNQLYPQEVDSSNPMANRDVHVTYFGEILASYIIDPD